MITRRWLGATKLKVQIAIQQRDIHRAPDPAHLHPVGGDEALGERRGADIGNGDVRRGEAGDHGVALDNRETRISSVAGKGKDERAICAPGEASGIREVIDQDGEAGAHGGRSRRRGVLRQGQGAAREKQAKKQQGVHEVALVRLLELGDEGSDVWLTVRARWGRPARRGRGVNHWRTRASSRRGRARGGHGAPAISRMTADGATRGETALSRSWNRHQCGVVAPQRLDVWQPW